MIRRLVVLSAVALACAPSERVAGSTERFEVPVGNVTFYAEVRATEVDAMAVLAEIRLRREDGSTAGAVSGGASSWTGVVPDEGIDVMFANLQSAPGVPAPLNAVVLHVKATVDTAHHVHFDLSSDAMCIR
jgi:hypothetical protein